MLISRRRLIAVTALATGGLAVGFGVPRVQRLRDRWEQVPALGEPGWIAIAADNRITASSTLTEMGQGISSCLAQIVADELEADIENIDVAMAASWRAYASPIGFTTGGSTSTQRLFAQMRTIAAATRHVLIEAAARNWGVRSEECRAVDGHILHAASGASTSFGSVALAAAGIECPTDPPLKPRAEWRWMGRELNRHDAAAMVDGRARYGIDSSVPDMLVAAVAQSPFAGASIAGLEEAAARAQSGVVDVIRLDDAVAVVAKTYWQARCGLDRARVRWTDPPASMSSTALREQLRSAASNPWNDEAPAAGRIVTALYDVPLLMHAQLEPLNVTAHVTRFAAEVWAPTQVQTAMRNDIARALGLWAHAVTVHTPSYVGGSFGRRLGTDDGVMAARIAREVRVPVKTIWSREEDCVQGRFRPMCAVGLRATLDGNGALVRLQTHLASTEAAPRTSGLHAGVYAHTVFETHYSSIDSPIRTGPWRSIDRSHNTFFREGFIDECAHAAGADPLDYRRTMLAGNARALRVLQSVAELSGWNERSVRGRFLGLAFCDGFGSLTAQVAEIERTSGGGLRVARIFAVVDCGTAINPNTVRAQLEGGILFGLSAALSEEAVFDGALRQRNFDGYRVLRLADAPAVSVQVLETPAAALGGIGEVGVPCVAPAVVNALFAATGVRLRSLPLSRSKLSLQGAGTA